jgi:hypothetical protein
MAGPWPTTAGGVAAAAGAAPPGCEGAGAVSPAGREAVGGGGEGGDEAPAATPGATAATCPVPAVGATRAAACGERDPGRDSREA